MGRAESKYFKFIDDGHLLKKRKTLNPTGLDFSSPHVNGPFNNLFVYIK
jgi:hypothetical protein